MKTFLLILSFMAAVTSGQAQSFQVVLNGIQAGGGGRQGLGNVNVTLNGATLTLVGTFSGISVGANAAHIHGPAAAGSTASPVYNFGGLGLITLGGMSGTMSGTFSLAPVGAYTVAQQLTDLNNSLWYFNIHSTTFGGGEIRGQITPVLEPSTVGLVGLGLGGLLLSMRRRGTQ